MMKVNDFNESDDVFTDSRTFLKQPCVGAYKASVSSGNMMLGLF